MDTLTLDKIKAVKISTLADDLGMKVNSRNHKSLCPFHSDHHPSLKLYDSTGTFKCFACGAQGSGIELVKRYREISYYDALLWIAAQENILIDNKPQRAYKPKKTSPKNTPKMESTQQLPTVVTPLDSTLLQRCQSAESPFCQALVVNNILTPAQMHHAALRYRLGITRDGGVIFWQIDQRQQVLDGKIMFYTPDCHRDHNHNPSWVSYRLKKKGELGEEQPTGQCLFGLHLLQNPTAESTENGNKRPTIAVVESEKTAIICSELHPELLWMATGGLSYLSTQILAPLKGHNVIIFPDTDPDGSAFSKWSEITARAAEELHSQFSICNLLEHHATPEQKARKIDIADYLIRG